PPGVTTDAVERITKWRRKVRGEFVEGLWKGEEHALEVKQVTKNPPGDDTGQEVPNTTLTWDLKVNPFLAGTPTTALLDGFQKVTIICHGTFVDTSTWVRGGLFSGFQPNRVILWAEQYAGFLKALGLKARSIDVIACVSALFAKSLSEMLP